MGVDKREIEAFINSLSRKLASKEFTNILKVPCDSELLWNITGGNPRAILDIYSKFKYDIKEYIAVQIEKVRRALKEEAIKLSKLHSISFNNAIKTLLCDLSNAINNLNELDSTLLWNTLLKYNITISVDVRFDKLSNIIKDYWIAERCAFQIPIYYWIIKTMIEESSDEVDVEEVLKKITQ